MLTDKQIQGVRNVKTAIKYHQTVFDVFHKDVSEQNNYESFNYIISQQHNLMRERLQWTLEQFFTQEELDSVSEI